MKLKVGDKVKVVRKGESHASRIHVHKRGIITWITVDGAVCSLDLDSGHNFWTNELELIQLDWDD